MNVKAYLARMRELSAERDKLLRGLERSLALQVLWPGVFDSGGTVKSYVIGSPSTGYRFVIEAGAEKREYSIAEAPDVLVPDKEIYLPRVGFFGRGYK